MNRDDKKPAGESFAEPVTASPLFAMPPVTAGEIVLTSGSSPAIPGRQPQPMTSLVLTTEEQVQQQAERDRLLGLCRHLRGMHRCPGECVLSPGRQERLLRKLGHNDKAFGDEPGAG